MSTYVLFVLFYFCNLFGISIRTSMQNLESEAQKMSELCSIQCAMSVTNLHVAVSVSSLLTVSYGFFHKDFRNAI